MASTARKHPAAVHRERRQQVEGCQRHVDPEELVEKAATDTHHFLRAARDSLAHRQHEIDADGQYDVDSRSGERHHDFLPGILGHPLQAGHPADGQERYVARADAVVPGGQCVTQLVQDHDAEQSQDEDQATYRLPQVAVRQVVRQGHPAEQKEKRGMDVDVDARNSANPPGPVHCCSPDSPCGWVAFVPRSTAFPVIQVGPPERPGSRLLEMARLRQILHAGLATNGLGIQPHELHDFVGHG